MFKRLVITVVFAALTALVGAGGDDAVFANEGSTAWLTDGTIQGPSWQGLPDNLNRSAKFVVLDGFRNNGLGAVGAPGQTTTMVLTFDRAPSDDCLRVALFDPNSIGRWDQAVDGQLVRKAPDVIYEVFKPFAMNGGQEFCTEELLVNNVLIPANDTARVKTTSAYKDYNTDPLNNNDDVWVDLLDLSTADAASAGLQLPDGRFRVVIRATLVPAPSGIDFGEDHDPLTVTREFSFTGRERAAYKIAFNGTYLIPAGGVIGFAGGIIDESVTCAGNNGEGCGRTNDDMDAQSQTSDPVEQVDKNQTVAQKDAAADAAGVAYWYDGVFNFHIHSTQACKGNIAFQDADADWVDVANLTANDFDANGFLTGSKLTGIPPENVGRYVRPQDNVCGGLRNIGQTLLPNGTVLATCADQDRLVEFDATSLAENAKGVVNWHVFPLTGGYFDHINDAANDTAGTFNSRQNGTEPGEDFGGRASYTAAREQQENGGAGQSPFKTNNLIAATLQADPGLWCLQWRGLDCANFVFMKFDRPVGTTPRPTLKIEVFCDKDGDCERGDNDTVLPVNGGKAKLTLTEVDCQSPNDPVVGGLAIQIETDANGVWNSPDCPSLPAGCYKIDWDGGAPLPTVDGCLSLPTIVNLTSDTVANQCVEVQIPVNCTGTIAGDVYCKETTGPCTYDDGVVDTPLPVGTKIRVIATRMTINGPESVEKEVTAPDTAYMFDGLEFDTYTVSYEFISADVIPLKAPCTPTRDVTLTPDDRSATDVDFGFDCAMGSICGDVYCEDGRNCAYDQTDMPLPTGTKYIVVLTPVVNGVPVPAEAQTIEQTAPKTDYCFEMLKFGTYEITVIDDPASTPIQMLPPLKSSCDEKKTVTLTRQVPEVEDCDFGYDCKVKICGDVYCENTDDCLYDDNVNDKPLPAGTVVIVTLTDAAGDPAGMQRIVAPATRFCFENLDYGTYTLNYAFEAGSAIWELAPDCDEEKEVTVDVTTGSVDDCDFGFECVGDICGDVYCESGRDCLYDPNAGDEPLPAGTKYIVILSSVDGQTVTEVARQNFTAPATRYCFEDLPLGTYELTVVEDPTTPANLPLPDLSGNCESAKRATLSAQQQNVDDCDFGYVCEGEICGDVYCEETGNCLYDAGTPDGPLPDGSVVIVTLTPIVGGQPDLGNQQMRTVTAPDTRYCFDELPFGTYEISYAFQAGTTVLELAGQCEEVKTVTVDASTTPIDDCDFGFICDADITGYVFCDVNLNGTYEMGTDTPPVSATVEAQRQDVPLPPALSTSVGANGFFEFADIPPGTYVLRVTAIDPSWWEPLFDNINGKTVTVPAGESREVLFPYDCRLSEIHGRVYCDEDFDGKYTPGVDTPFQGVKVSASGPGAPPPDATTNQFGEYSFTGLQPGAWNVTVDPNQPPYTDPAPRPTDPAPVDYDFVLQRGDIKMDVDFLSVCLGRICVCVYQNPLGDCDDEYDDTDILMDGVRVRLTGGNLPANGVIKETDADGNVCFEELRAGDYQVSVETVPGKWVDLGVARKTATPIDVKLPSLGDEKVWIGYCVQSICGRVFCEPDGFWDGIYDKGRDDGLGNVLVEITLPDGTTRTTRTEPLDLGNDDIGTYCFFDVPVGPYEIRIKKDDAQTIAVLTGLIGDRDRVLTPDVTIGQELPDQDFPFCKCEQELCVTVFKEEVDVCNNEYDENVDAPVEFVEVRIEQLSTGRNTTLMTGADGRICLPIVEPGDYKISVNPRQPAIGDCRPSLGSSTERIVSFDPAECDDQELFFGFCCCTKKGCCYGKLSEVVMETRFWMCDPDYKAVARLYMNCRGDDLVDEAEAVLVGDRFSQVPGIDGVIKIESIKKRGPLVTVRVRVKATGPRFPLHHFGNDKHLVTVTLNGETSQLCEVFRAETLRPGSIPGCKRWDKKLCRWVPIKWPCDPAVMYKEVDWDAYDCGNLCWKFGIVEICCFRDWCRCNCDCPERECEPCKGYVTKLTLRYDGDRHVHCTILQSDDGRLLFDKGIKPGALITLEAKGDDGTMGTEIKIATNKICIPIKVKCHPLLRIGTSFGGFTIVGGASSEGGPFCDPKADVNGRPIDPKCRACCIPERPCDCIGGVTHLAFKYLGKKPKWAVIWQADDGRYIFDGMVYPGDIIRVRAAGDDGTMGTKIKLATNAFCGDLDVTCREPIGVGTQSGPFVVIGGKSYYGGRFCGSPKCNECPEDKEPEPKPCDNCPK